MYNEWKDVGYDGHTFLQTSVAANFISRYTALMLPRCVGNYFNGNGHGNICSCIVAEVLMRAEVMNSRRSPYEYPPEAFGERNNDIELIPTVKLGDVEEIIPYKWNDKQYWDKRMKSYSEKFDVVRRGIGGFLYKLNLHA